MIEPGHLAAGALGVLIYLAVGCGFAYGWRRPDDDGIDVALLVAGWIIQLMARFWDATFGSL